MNITNAASAAPFDTDDAFHAATAAALRALGVAPAHVVAFGRLFQSGPEQTEFPTLADNDTLRALADLEAATLRFGHAYSKEFDNPLKNEVFRFLDNARMAACLAADYTGVRKNILPFWTAHDAIDFKTRTDTDPPETVLNDIITSARHIWLGADTALPADPFVNTSLQLLKNTLHDPWAFFTAAQNLLDYLWSGTVCDAQNPPPAEPPRAISSSDENPNNAEKNETLDGAPDEKPDTPPPPMGGESGDDTGRQGDTDNTDDGLNPPPPATDGTSHAHMTRYRIFDTSFDEIIGAETLGDLRERQKLRADLETQLLPFQRLVQKLAVRLQRQLQTFQHVGWQRGLDDGELDLQRLPSVYAHRRRRAPSIYKLPHMGLARDSVVTLLLDNSGSMRGRPIMMTALCADILARTLERCGVKVEILGYTTRAWKGGQPYKNWMAADKPPAPGRLNELRHIIYKHADQTWRAARLNVGMMLREGLLRENIDGEALMWAHARLAKRHEKRKILMVISDGAPVDDATLSANGPDYLETHLTDTITWVQAQKRVDLVAIGIGHDVTRYYPRATVIKDVETLGQTMLDELGRLLRA